MNCTWLVEGLRTKPLKTVPIAGMGRRSVTAAQPTVAAYSSTRRLLEASVPCPLTQNWSHSPGRNSAVRM